MGYFPLKAWRNVQVIGLRAAYPPRPEQRATEAELAYGLLCTVLEVEEALNFQKALDDIIMLLRNFQDHPETRSFDTRQLAALVLESAYPDLQTRKGPNWDQRRSFMLTPVEGVELLVGCGFGGGNPSFTFRLTFQDALLGTRILQRLKVHLKQQRADEFSVWISREIHEHVLYIQALNLHDWIFLDEGEAMLGLRVQHIELSGRSGYYRIAPFNQERLYVYHTDAARDLGMRMNYPLVLTRQHPNRAVFASVGPLSLALKTVDARHRVEVFLDRNPLIRPSPREDEFAEEEVDRESSDPPDFEF